MAHSKELKVDKESDDIATAEPLAARDERCTWIENYDAVWETKCNELFAFSEGGPLENGFEFCPYCGKNLNPIRWPGSMYNAKSNPPAAAGRVD